MKACKALSILTMAVFTGCVAPPSQQQPNDPQDKEMRAKVLKEIPAAPTPPQSPSETKMAVNEALRRDARDQILKSFQSSSTVLRCQAIEAAQNGMGTGAGGLIMAGLKDSKPLVRFASAMAAGTLKYEDARAELAAIAEDEDPSVCVAVRYALHQLGDTSLSHDLEKFAGSPSPVVRRNTVMVLGLLNERSAIKILRPMQRDPDSAVRVAAAEAMWRLGDDDGLKACVGLVVSQFPDDQILGCLALAATHDERVRPYLRGKLTTPYDEVNLVAARALGMIGQDTGYAVAQKGAKAADPRQRALAALAFGSIGRADAQSILSGLLKDSDEGVRIAAAMAALQLKDS